VPPLELPSEFKTLGKAIVDNMRRHLASNAENFDRVLKTIQRELAEKAREIATNQDVIWTALGLLLGSAPRLASQ
jgi:hypothetical protein